MSHNACGGIFDFKLRFPESITEGRLRIRSESLKLVDSAELFEALKQVKGVENLKLNKITRSLLVNFEPAFFDESRFEEILNSTLESQADSAGTKSATKAKSAKQQKLSAYRAMRKVENQTMALAGPLCLLGLSLKLWKLHSLAGWIFTAASAAHTLRYKKQLLR